MRSRRRARSTTSRRTSSSACCVRPTSRSTASSNLYVASLAGGQFTYNTDTVGYVVQVRPPTDDAVARGVGVQGDRRRAPHRSSRRGTRVHRLHAQQELLRRGAKPAVVAALRRTIADEQASADARAAAIFTLKQLQGSEGERRARAAPRASTDARVRETALRALADRTDQLQGVSPALYVKALGRRGSAGAGAGDPRARATRRARCGERARAAHGQRGSGDLAPRGERARLARRVATRR